MDKMAVSFQEGMTFTLSYSTFQMRKRKMAEEVKYFSVCPKKKQQGSVMNAWSTEQSVVPGALHSSPLDQEVEQRVVSLLQKEQK